MSQQVSETQKTHFVFPKRLITKIDKVAGKRKRSRFVVQAAKEKLARVKFSEALKNSAGAWSDKNHPQLSAKKDVAKYIREQRDAWQNRTKEIYG